MVIKEESGLKFGFPASFCHLNRFRMTQKRNM